jgi:hypothetical protein
MHLVERSFGFEVCYYLNWGDPEGSGMMDFRYVIFESYLENKLRTIAYTSACEEFAAVSLPLTRRLFDRFMIYLATLE